MVTIIDARRIRDIVGGGPFAGGGIYITLAFPTGSTETFHCDLALVPRLIGHLRQFSVIASKARTAAEAPDMTPPLAVERVAAPPPPPDAKSVTMAFLVREGFPIELALTRRQARAAIKVLEEQLAKRRPPPRKPSRSK